MSWNNNNPGGFAPSGGYRSAPPPFPNFPSPNAGNPGGYQPSYSPSYAPPASGPLGSLGGFGPPPGPPPAPVSRGSPGYPGAQYHQAHPGGFGGGPGPFGPPPGPPPGQGGYNAPPGSAPGYGSYGAPPGPPPGQWAPPSGPPSGQWGAPSPGQGGPWGASQTANHPYSPGPYAPPPGPPHMPPSQQQHYGPKFEGADHQAQQTFFQYSQCNGKKKALLIGINYFNTDAELKGCINDVLNVKRFLSSHWGYKEADIVMLTDDAKNPRQKPTKENILDAMRWLVQNAQPNDSLFFHYSGHGGQTKDLDGDEEDGYDEVIYPLDFKTNGHIVDDEIHATMVQPLPAGCRLTGIFDSCHSGSAMDLPYIYSTEGKIKEPNLAAEAGAGLLSAVTSYARGDMSGVFKSAMGLVKSASGNGSKANAYAKKTRTSPADVISFSGCKDSQTSADTVEAGQATGAMSYAFIAALTAQHEQSFQQLLNGLRDILKNKYSQKPQLSSSHPMDTTVMFLM